MASFYGGSPGLSMMIVKSYLTKEDMINDFKSTSCKVGIGECVCIDSGLNDGEHGNVYRRTTESTQPEYVGNMSGPIGPGVSYAAKVTGNSSTDVSEQINTALGDKAQELQNKCILFEDSNASSKGTWIYAYDHIKGKWFKLAGYNNYVISKNKPTNLSVGGIWIKVQNI